ncbi:hemerythrin domain-containing protein [Conexibacter sp. DBS9H8]|uniref:hemerythrin domain-containing protein n=1 Tax=Conexibacter sp. DBS9H8 TaxID=2937801 RepID=UPI00200E6380|nr:hemerythrin domain-containing protein [Conexibacter sp. DBS9H8]MDA8067910.1 hemerythrin domain-containing protein [Actinomycetota bacterium]
MKRSAALAPLSRDHHHALVVASALTRAGEGTCYSSAMLFADFIADHEARHFALEESLLLPTLPPGERARLLAERMRADHEHLRETAGALRQGRLQPTVELTASLGARLRAHVQLEERELFPYIEQSLDAASLEQLGMQLEAGT